MSTQLIDLIGKVVAKIEVDDYEVLITFEDGSRLQMTPSMTGGDYGSPYINTNVVPPPVDAEADTTDVETKKAVAEILLGHDDEAGGC